MSLIKCPSCQRDVSDDVRFCKYCGFEIVTEKKQNEPVIQCPKCIKDIPGNSKFCSYCGHQLITEKIADNQLIKCPYCFKKIPKTSERCPKCGYKFVPEKSIDNGHLVKCPNCNQNTLSSEEDCIYCRTKITPQKFEQKHLIQCPNCKKDTVSSEEKCIYCRFELSPKNLKNLHLIWCPKCKTDIISTSQTCYNCGYKLSYSPTAEVEDVKRVDKIYTNAGLIGIVLIIFLFVKLCSPSSTSIDKTPSYSGTITDTGSINKYFVNEDVIFAATNEANYKMLMNCITSRDMQAIELMVATGQVKYLYRNDIVYLVKGGILNCIVRPEGSMQNLYVICEQITKK
ncbi:MAG TPA: zinc ribbon domain-containing protein [Bacteroidales bacterium]|nr:zinc ribbon domain-containing protein [Bacteroidales bacterium]